MKKQLRLKAGELDLEKDPKAYTQLSPEKKLAHAILANTLRDVYKNPIHVTRARAKVWLLDESDHEFGARWWAESSGLESFLNLLREIVKDERGMPMPGPWYALWGYRDGKDK